MLLPNMPALPRTAPRPRNSRKRSIITCSCGTCRWCIVTAYQINYRAAAKARTKARRRWLASLYGYIRAELDYPASSLIGGAYIAHIAAIRTSARRK
jgi:hypothetical protein